MHEDFLSSIAIAIRSSGRRRRRRYSNSLHAHSDLTYPLSRFLLPSFPLSAAPPPFLPVCRQASKQLATRQTGLFKSRRQHRPGPCCSQCTCSVSLPLPSPPLSTPLPPPVGRWTPGELQGYTHPTSKSNLTTFWSGICALVAEGNGKSSLSS